MSKERKEDTRCLNGVPEITIQNIPLLVHAANVYTIQAYSVFEDNYLSGLSCIQRMTGMEGRDLSYVVWKPQLELFAHSVLYNMDYHTVSCSCLKFQESRMLCCHALRIYNVNSVQQIPDIYILKRWTRMAKPTDHEATASTSREIYPSSSESSSVWGVGMKRKLYTLIEAADHNESARSSCEIMFEKAKEEVEMQVGSIYFSDSDDDIVMTADGITRNPNKSRKKGERNDRYRSMSEKKKNQARSRTRRRIVQTYGQQHPYGSTAFVQTVLEPMFVNPPATG